MVDVVLVFMPYGTVDRPSIGLGYLAAGLAGSGITSHVIHANLLFAERIGLRSFNRLNGSSNVDLLGEWTFSGAAFPDFDSDPDAYFRDLHAICADEDEREIRRVRGLARPFVDELAERIVAMRPKLVGCSSMFQQNTASLALLRRIRELAPEIVTAMGGANCETLVGRALHSYYPWVDYVFSGECDDLFPKFCRRLFHPDAPENAPVEGEVWPPESVLTPETRALGVERPVGLALTTNMDGLPLPSFEDYFHDLRESPLRADIAPAMILETSRGCWWGAKTKCTFCGLSADTIGFRSKSPDVAYREINQLYDKYKLRHFELVDNIMDNKYYDELLPRLFGDPREFQFFYEIKANVTRNQVKALADAGVVWVQPGIESLNDKLLKVMRKGATACHNLQLLKWCREFGVYVMWNYLFNIPHERDEWHAEELEIIPLLHHLQAPWNAGTPIRFDRFSVYGTRPEEFGLDLVPSRVYRHIYPLTPEQLRHQAYFFENLRPEVVNEGRPQPLMDELRASMMDWRRIFYETNGDRVSDNPRSELPVLNWTDDEDGHLILTDTRACAVRPRWEFEGLEAAIYRICDVGEPEPLILRRVREEFDANATEGEVSVALNRLVETKTLARVGGRCLGLAVRGGGLPYRSMELEPLGCVA